jgi:hypothetical protein
MQRRPPGFEACPGTLGRLIATLRIKGELLHIIRERPCQNIYCLRYDNNNYMDKICKKFKQLGHKQEEHFKRIYIIGICQVTTLFESVFCEAMDQKEDSANLLECGTKSLTDRYTKDNIGEFVCLF